VQKPRSKPGLADMMVWSEEAYQKVSEVVNGAFLSIKEKKNLRQLTKSDIADLEQLKIDVFTNLDIMSDVTANCVYENLSAGVRTPVEFQGMLEAREVSTDKLNIDNYRKRVIGVYIEYLYP
jgi:hypothetical protein